MMHLRNTGVGNRITISLEVYLLGSYLLVLPTSLQHSLSSIPECVKFVVLILSIDSIHIQDVVNILACFSI